MSSADQRAATIAPLSRPTRHSLPVLSLDMAAVSTAATPRAPPLALFPVLAPELAASACTGADAASRRSHDGMEASPISRHPMPQPKEDPLAWPATSQWLASQSISPSPLRRLLLTLLAPAATAAAAAPSNSNAPHRYHRIPYGDATQNSSPSRGCLQVTVDFIVILCVCVCVALWE